MRRSSSLVLVVALLAAGPRWARGGDRAAPAPDASTSAPELAPDSAAEAAGAPAPGDAHGIASGRPTPSWVRWIPRVILFPVRAVVEVVGAPIRLGSWTADHYEIVDRVTEAFFSGPPGVLIYRPVLRRESGFGMSYGVELGHKDILGSGLQVTVRGLWGGEFRQAYRTTMSTRSLVPDWFLRLGTKVELRDGQRFYGIGNHDLGAPGDGADPTEVSVASRFRQTFVTTSFKAIYEAHRPLVFGAILGHRVRSFFTSGSFDDDESIGTLYDTSQIHGFDDGVSQGYGELQVMYDTTGAGSIWDSPGLTTTGAMALAYAGYAHDLDSDRYQYLRYGTHAVKHMRISDGPRVISAMGYVDALRRIEGEVPFIDLPALGGSRRLRGWHGRRFSDNVAVAATLQYQFALTRTWAMTLFADAGNVVREWTDADVSGTRLGFGAEWLWFTQNGLLARFGVGFSSENDVLFNLSFSPNFAPQGRL